MKVIVSFFSLCVNVALAVLSHRLQEKHSMGHHFGPSACVSLSVSSAGTCTLATDCGNRDLSKVEFAFDCEDKDGSIDRHSFGYGGFDAFEEFDTEVRCSRCLPPSEISTLVTPAPQVAPVKAVEPVHPVELAQPVAPAADVPRNRTQPVAETQKPIVHMISVSTEATRHELRAKTGHRQMTRSVADEKRTASQQEHALTSAVHHRKLRRSQKLEADARERNANRGFFFGDGDQVISYGPKHCVSLWKNEDDECVMETDCSPSHLRHYEFGLVCVDGQGVPTRHIFGKNSFDPQETFNTLIRCDQCLGLEEISDKVAVNGKMAVLTEEVSDLKHEMLSMSSEIRSLEKKLFAHRGDEESDHEVREHRDREEDVSDAEEREEDVSDAKEREEDVSDAKTEEENVVPRQRHNQSAQEEVEGENTHHQHHVHHHVHHHLPHPAHHADGEQRHHQHDREEQDDARHVSAHLRGVRELRNRHGSRHARRKTTFSKYGASSEQDLEDEREGEHGDTSLSQASGKDAQPNVEAVDPVSDGPRNSKVETEPSDVESVAQSGKGNVVDSSKNPEVQDLA